MVLKGGPYMNWNAKWKEYKKGPFDPRSTEVPCSKGRLRVMNVFDGHTCEQT